VASLATIMPADPQDASYLFDLVERLSPALSAPLYPVCSLENSVRPVPHASAVCLSVGPRRFILTAAHVRDDAGDLPLGVILPTHVAVLSGDWLIPARIGESLPSRLDLALLEPSLSLRSSLENVPAVSLSAIASLSPSRETATITAAFFVTMGYPLGKQPRRFVPPEYRAHIWRLLSKGAPVESYPSEGVDPEHHLLLEFNKKRVFTSLGLATSPDPIGASGGAVWWIRVTDRGPDPRLVAIPTVWRKQARQILATRVFVALAALWHAFPDLRPLLDQAD